MVGVLVGVAVFTFYAWALPSAWYDTGIPMIYLPGATGTLPYIYEYLAMLPAYNPLSMVPILGGWVGWALGLLKLAAVFGYLLPTLAGVGGFQCTICLATLACTLSYTKQAYVFSLSYGVAMALIGGVIFLASGGASTLCGLHALLVAGPVLRGLAELSPPKAAAKGQRAAGAP